MADRKVYLLKSSKVAKVVRRKYGKDVYRTWGLMGAEKVKIKMLKRKAREEK